MNANYVYLMEMQKDAELKKREEHKQEMYVEGTYIPGLTAGPSSVPIPNTAPLYCVGI